MTDDLAKRLKTPGAFDSPWLQEQLRNWDAIAEYKKAVFMEHMYQCSFRQDGLYTGLWQDFCMEEAGPYCREKWFEMMEAVRLYEEGKLPAVAMDTEPVVTMS
jgi:hypothetical protein